MTIPKRKVSPKYKKVNQEKQVMVYDKKAKAKSTLKA
jgi:hypothetical protein